MPPTGGWMDEWTGTGTPPAMPILGLIPSNDPKEPSGKLLTRRAHVRQLMQPTWDAICRSLSMERQRQERGP